MTIYNLHTNTYPFLGKGYDVKKTQKKIIKGNYTWPKTKNGAPPQEMIDIVRDFLKKRPESTFLFSLGSSPTLDAPGTATRRTYPVMEQVWSFMVAGLLQQ